VRLRHHARVGGKHAVDVGKNLAHLGLKRRGQGHGGGVAPTTAEGGDLALARHALVASDDDHPARLELLENPHRTHLDDAGRGMGLVGDDAALASGEADGRDAELVQGHGEKGHADALAAGEQHVQLAPGRVQGHLLGQPEKLVGGVAHRRHHHHQAMPIRRPRPHPLGHLANPRHVGDGRAAVFLDDDGHAGRGLLGELGL
jgi:hypothetical protein